MTWQKNKIIYEKIISNEINFPEESIELEVLVELVALQKLDNLININYKSFNKDAISEMILSYDNMINVISKDIFNDKEIMLDVVKNKVEYYEIVSEKLKNDFNFIFEVYKINPKIISYTNTDNFTSKEIFLLLQESSKGFKNLISKLSKLERIIAIDILLENIKKEEFLDEVSFEDATLEQAKKLVSYRLKNFNFIKDEYKQDIELICIGLEKDKKNQKDLGYNITTKFKKRFISILVEGFMRNTITVDSFLINFKGTITEDIWGAMLCNQDFLLKIEKLGIDPFINDNDYEKYIREINLKEKMEEQNKEEQNQKIKRKI